MKLKGGLLLSCKELFRMAGNNLISIIIPVYNVAPFLARCLDSVVNQTYSKLEIILVNDGSTDSCPRICDEYAAKDNRIKVIHKENGGLSDARNAGINAATGELISFVDSDDVLSQQFFQKLLEALVTYNADIAECEFKKFIHETELISCSDELKNSFQILEGEIIMEALFKGPFHVMVWNKLYKTALLRGRLFPLNRINEDVFWTYRIFGEASKTVKIDEELYFYRQREHSIMASTYSLKRLDSLHAYEEKIEYLEEKFPNLVKDVRKTYCFLLMENYIQLQLHPNVDPEGFHQKTILSKIKKYNNRDEIKNWHWKDVVWFYLFLWSPTRYRSLRKYMERKSARLQNVTA